MKTVRVVLVCVCCVLAAVVAQAQVTTGSIAGNVTDSSNAVLPGVTVTLTGEKLIGGAQSQPTDTAGNYRFDRLPPGVYQLRFELSGFRPVDREGIRVSAAFVAAVSVKLEVGAVNESITVTGDSPTVDTKSNLQQTVMSQEILEGIPTGRDPWSVARLIPGVQVSTYDVGGTQSIQQSGLSSHGSSGSDVSFNVDGATVNWPGGGGGSTMMYYDQGMFEEVNYMTSAIPAEVLAGGLSINMVTKDAGNRWRGNLRYSFSNDDLQAENHLDIQRRVPAFLGNPTLKTYDVNLSGGGRIVRDRVWFNGTIRRWVVNKLTNARNPDGSQALDDNTLKNYSGKVVTAFNPNQKLMVSYLWNDKIRGHRRDSNDKIPDIAAVLQTNPVQTTQVKYTGVLSSRLVYDSGFSVMDGQTNYTYQPGTPADAIRKVDSTLGEVYFASPRHEEQPNSRHQIDNVVAYNTSGLGGEHLFKAGVQVARLFFEQRYTVQGHHFVEYANGRPTQVRLFNTPTDSKNLAQVLGFFVQDSWSIGNRLTLNLGARFDKYKGILPAQSNTGVAFDLFTPAGLDSDQTGPFIEPRSIEERVVLNQSKAVWRAGLAYDLTGNGRTAVKASYSRYALQVGINRVQDVNPLGVGNRTCPWTDPNGDGRFQTSEINFAQCSAFSGGVNTLYAADGVDWPYSDEVTAGVERQIMTDMRVGVMFYYRTNRDQLGVRNTAVPPTGYTAVTVRVPNGPGGTVASPKPTTVTLYNLTPTLVGAANNVRDNEPGFDTEYKGVEFTASKRFSRRWQMVGGLTLGKNEGGLGGDLNDPANQGYPYVSSYNLTRAVAATQGIVLTRATQSVTLSQRGDERLPNVTLADIRISRAIKLGARRIVPTLDLFNIGNAATVVSLNNAVGTTYLEPREILAPRIIRVGLSIDF
ncbi:MAG: TonB-dependent receptor [Acidobacteria bacterium]|nr:TonB-dependent receptor [Acidobacteriota bacterium]